MQKVTIYGRDNCGYCRMARDLCERRGFEFRYIDMIAEGISKADLQSTLGRPVYTVPQILIGSEYIGGYTDFAARVGAR
ncbi:GrxA family glutaredoxin [Parathalassolituus penaei]|uniref:GrxA family glutaredoxin n=1 Tax=Parathalassolituus penaei TaxID=2997323 RepID=A0A9X3IRN1_9GAMM|nr:GrxA family glutaredoxin [Parathalassolituus penaei]MCY0964029.1 GrxA family glutaredoxin [Parathalassolituus penaei]